MLFFPIKRYLKACWFDYIVC